MIFLKNLFLYIFFIALTNSYDMDQLNIGVWLSGAAYCGKDNYKTMKLDGPASKFIYKDTLYDKKTDLEGYIGILSSTIYVILRGSSSAKNWLDDFEARLVSYDTYPECKCKVHNGFYHSVLGVKNQTIETVLNLQKQYPTYSVMITGHSYGASCGQLLAMELERNGINTKIYNYGQPRVGDEIYAKFVNKKISEYYRATHHKDIVPHVPPTSVMGYLHSCREIYEDATGQLTLCSATNGEDPTCANQFKLSETSGDDHSYYLGHHLSCEDSTK